jgi:hypothetical protein
MNLCRRLAALFVLLALVGCAQATTEQGNAPYSPENMHDRGGGGAM